jgi:hypothetical protein
MYKSQICELVSTICRVFASVAAQLEMPTKEMAGLFEAKSEYRALIKGSPCTKTKDMDADLYCIVTERSSKAVIECVTELPLDHDSFAVEVEHAYEEDSDVIEATSVHASMPVVSA